MQVNDSSALRLLLAGCGSIGKRHGQVLRDMGVENIFACDPSEEQRNSFQAVLPEAKLLRIMKKRWRLSDPTRYLFSRLPLCIWK